MWYDLLLNGKLYRTSEYKHLIDCNAYLFIDADCVIWSVYTDEQYRNRGLMTKLLKMVLSWNYPYSLFVYPDNIIAIDLYKKLGFIFDKNAPENKYKSKRMIYKNTHTA